MGRAHARETAGHLQAGLASNRDIGVAIGRVMASQQLDRDAAFEVLRGISQNTNRKLADIAAHVIHVGESGTQPPRLRLVSPRGPRRVQEATVRAMNTPDPPVPNQGRWPR